MNDTKDGLVLGLVGIIIVFVTGLVSGGFFTWLFGRKKKPATAASPAPPPASSVAPSTAAA